MLWWHLVTVATGTQSTYCYLWSPLSPSHGVQTTELEARPKCCPGQPSLLTPAMGSAISLAGWLLPGRL